MLRIVGAEILLDCFVTLKHLRVLLKLIPYPLNQLLKEDILDLVKKLFMLIGLCSVTCGNHLGLVAHEDTLDALQVYLVKVVNEKVIIRHVNHG